VAMGKLKLQQNLSSVISAIFNQHQ